MKVQALSGDIPGVTPGRGEGMSPAHNPQATRLAIKKPGCVTATRGDSATKLTICYAMASTIALKVAQGRIAFDVLTGSES